MKQILFACGEGLPFIKSGGLADVVGSLPQKFDKKNFNVAVVLPLYKKIAEKFEFEEVGKYIVASGIIYKEATLYKTIENDVEYYFIRQDDYFYRDSMYGYDDDGERFAFFSKAVLEMLPLLEEKVDIIHCHDWHTGMIPLMGKTEYRDYRNEIRYVYTIHNLAFQGNFPYSMLDCFNIDRKYYADGSIKFDQGISYMKAGILYADKVTTVSQSYVEEILTHEYGERMEGPLNSRRSDLVGIVNGIDTNMWNPETDENIYKNYSKDDLSGKVECKKSIQHQLGLRVTEDTLLIGIVTRLTWQKGASIILEKLSEIMNQDVQLIILGTGDPQVEAGFQRLERDYPHRAVFYRGYNEKLSHEIYAGCDLFLMPSLFEPCGISQLISLRYGTLPLVREVGGLRDTVIPYNQYDKTGTGFSFRHFSGNDLIHLVKYAIEVYYYHKDDWKMLMNNAMSYDVSWDKSAVQYEELYNSL